MKYVVLSVLGLGLALLLYDNFAPMMMGDDQAMMANPHSVQTTSGNAGAPLVDIVVPNLSAGATAGQAAFETNCAACHGQNAVGQDGVAPPLVHIIYEPNHHGDQSFYRAVQQGVRAHHWRFGNMPAVQGVSQSDVTDIIAYVRELQRANNIF